MNLTTQKLSNPRPAIQTILDKDTGLWGYQIRYLNGDLVSECKPVLATEDEAFEAAINDPFREGV